MAYALVGGGEDRVGPIGIARGASGGGATAGVTVGVTGDTGRSTLVTIGRTASDTSVLIEDRVCSRRTTGEAGIGIFTGVATSGARLTFVIYI